MERVHSKLSASGAHRWLACPGSIRLSEGLESVSSKYAQEGTAAHQVADRCFRTGCNAKKFLGETILVEDNSYEVTQEMAEAVQIYLDTVRADYHATENATLFYEKEHKLDWLRKGMWGTNDASIGSPSGLLRIYDFKYGAGVIVDVEDNAQMMYYALGPVGPSGGGYTEVELVVVQPRAPHEDGVVRRCSMSVRELLAWAQDVLLPGAVATDDPAAPLVTGSHCRFCPALAICPAQKDQAYAVAKTVFADKPTAPPAPATLSIKELRRILDVSDLVSAWFDACRVHVRSLLDSGKTTPEEVGYKFVTGRSSRDWSDSKAAEEYLAALLDDEAYTPKKLISPAQAEKILTGETAKKAIATLVKKVEGRKQLVPVSDKRPAVSTAISAFTEIPEEFL